MTIRNNTSWLPLDRVTVIDVLESGACWEGVRDYILATRVIAAEPIDTTKTEGRLRVVSKRDGTGTGTGYGYGSGHSCGDGDGYGTGYGDGYGDGYGYGDGDGYGTGYDTGYGDGDGDGDGYGGESEKGNPECLY